ncbi:MAG: hypothetical protein H0U67_14305 [Gemmatimonadetes bacterium]|nr:hypothetical protein [Gemmatimonadota bacterium]
MIPKPFSRIRLIFGEPIEIGRDADAAEIERVSTLVEERLNRLTVAADE